MHFHNTAASAQGSESLFIFWLKKISSKMTDMGVFVRNCRDVYIYTHTRSLFLSLFFFAFSLSLFLSFSLFLSLSLSFSFFLFLSHIPTHSPTPTPTLTPPTHRDHDRSPLPEAAFYRLVIFFYFLFFPFLQVIIPLRFPKTHSIALRKKKTMTWQVWA